MKRKAGAQEHTIIIGTILGSIVVFVLGFFLGRVWVLMPQEKMIQVKKEHSSTTEEEERKIDEEFDKILAQIKEKKLNQGRKEKQEEAERFEEEKKKEREKNLALLNEIEKRKEQEKQEALAREREKEREREKREEMEKLLAKRKEEERKLAEKREAELKRKLQQQEEERRKRQEEEERKRREEYQKRLEAQRKASNEEMLKARETTSTPTPPTGEAEYFTIQLQSSQNKERVEELLAELRARGYAAYASRADLKEGGIWYRIRLGKYNTYEEAVRDAESLRSKGIISNYWITRK